MWLLATTTATTRHKTNAPPQPHTTNQRKQVGLLGRPFPISVLERLKGEGRLGTAPERDALARAREVVGDREGQGAMLEALRLRAMAKRLRAEADLAEVELANEKVCVCGLCVWLLKRRVCGWVGCLAVNERAWFVWWGSITKHNNLYPMKTKHTHR